MKNLIFALFIFISFGSLKAQRSISFSIEIGSGISSAILLDYHTPQDDFITNRTDYHKIIPDFFYNAGLKLKINYNESIYFGARLDYSSIRFTYMIGDYYFPNYNIYTFNSDYKAQQVGFSLLVEKDLTNRFYITYDVSANNILTASSKDAFSGDGYSPKNYEQRLYTALFAMSLRGAYQLFESLPLKVFVNYKQYLSRVEMGTSKNGIYRYDTSLGIEYEF